jgi:hypothetical protein
MGYHHYFQGMTAKGTVYDQAVEYFEGFKLDRA